MGKIKNWIRSKLMDYLGINNLINILDKHIDNNDNSFRELTNTVYSLNSSTRKELKNDISHFQESVNVLHNTVENVVHIGTNVCQTGKYNNKRSWAVICVEGKMNLVKFVSLDAKSIRDLLQYLKQFEAGRHCIDTPHPEIFYDGLFKL